MPSGHIYEIGEWCINEDEEGHIHNDYSHDARLEERNIDAALTATKRTSQCRKVLDSVFFRSKAEL
jgi:hypothetical protein